jgi:hypothetical protein
MRRAAVLLLIAIAASAAERRVNPAATGASEDGASWATAYRSLTTALSASVLGDEVWIKAGTYVPGVLVTSTFTVPDGVSLYGGFAGTETARGQRADDPGLTILSGEIGAATATDNVHQVVKLPGSATLDTLTVTRAYWSNSLSYVGTAVYGYTTAANKQVTMRRCRITDNWAARSNVVYVTGSAVTIDRCEFTANRDVLVTSDSANGGTVCLGGNHGVQIAGSVWAGNQVATTTLAASNLLIYYSSGDATVSNTVFVGNTGFAHGVRQTTPATYRLDLAACTIVDSALPGNDAVETTALRGCLLATLPTFVPATVENVWVVARDGDPLFTDAGHPAGTDGRWFTADDGLIPVAGSPCRGFARMVTTTAAPAMPGVDIRGLGRPQGRDPEPGAYEIDEGNRGPVATAQTVIVREDVVTAIVLAGVDPDGDPLRAWITTLPAHGRLLPTTNGGTASAPALTVADLPWQVTWANTVLYQPDADDNGADQGSCAFLVDDGQVQSHPVTVTVDIQPVNDAPTIDPVTDMTVLEDSGSRVLTLTGISAGTPGLAVGDPAREAQTISITAASSHPLLIPDPLTAYISPAGTAQLVFTPQPNASGSAVITVTVHDDGGTAAGGSDTRQIQFTVGVVPVNDSPQMDLIADRSMAEDTVDPIQTTITVTGIAPGPADESGQTLAIDASSGNPALLSIAGVDYVAGASSAQVHLVLQPNAHGTGLVYVSLFDDGGTANGGSDSAARVFRVTVTPVDDPPVLTTLEQLHCSAGSGVLITAADLWLTDPDEPAASDLVYTLTTLPQRGEIRLNNVALIVGGTFTQADILANRVAYWNTSISGTPLDVWELTWSDGSALGTQGPAAMIADIQGSFPPNLFLTGPGIPWTDGDPPSAIVVSAVIVDGDDPLPYTGGSITASIVAGAASGDVLSIADQGVGAGQVGVSGNQVSYGGTLIGTWAGGSGGTALVVSLNGATAGSTAAQAVVRALRFASDRNPGTATRTIRIVVNDGVLASSPQNTTVAVTPVDDPPAITTSWVSTLAGVSRDVQLQVDDPDSVVLAWLLGSQPAEADVHLIDAAQGIIRITPHAGISGTTSFWAFVSDGVNPLQPAIINLRIASLEEPRPHPASDAPSEVAAGERLSLTVAFDCSEIGGSTGLAFGGFGAVPSGLSITSVGPTTALVEWDVPIAEPAGVHAPFGVIATDPVTHASGCWPVLLTVRPSPGGGG